MSIEGIVTSKHSHPDEDCIRAVEIIRRACIKTAADKYKTRIIVGFENDVFYVQMEGHPEKFSDAKECMCWLKMADKIIHS